MGTLSSRHLTVSSVVLSAAFVLAAAVPVHGQAPLKSAVVSSLESRLARLERQLSAKTLYELLERLEAVQRDLQAMRGDIEIQRHDLERMKSRQRELFVEMDRLVSRGETAPSAAASAPAAEGVAGATPTAETSSLAPQTSVSQPAAAQDGARPSRAPVNPRVQAALPSPPKRPVAPAQTPALSGATQSETTAAPAAPSTSAGATAGAPAFDPLEEQGAYTAAFNLLKEGRYEKAAEAFESFLPKYQGGQYTDNAQYWLGEAFYVTRQFPRSMKEFQKLVTGYPQSPKVPGAQLKIGFIHHELGEIEQAKAVLGDLVARFPTTTAARLARDRLDRLSRQ